MRMQTKNLLFLAFTLLLASCSTFFDKDNTPDPKPLTNITPEVQPHKLWSVRTGDGSGSEYLKMSPSLGASNLYTASVSGTVTAVDKSSGRIQWQTNTRLPITSGTGVGDGLVVVGSRKGDVFALNESDGRVAWKTNVAGEVLAKPAIASDVVVIKTIDGHVRGLASDDGHVLWTFQQVEPSFILKGSSAPLLRENRVVAGFANGNLAKLSLNDGQLYWLQTLASPEGAFAIQRMIDVDADPIMFEHHLYAATFQGKITSLDWSTGRFLWTHDISSYTGMAADTNTAYISDAKGYVWAFGADNGLVNWRQTQLEYRDVSGPATMGNYVVVGDAQGFLHWLDKRDGHFAGRIFAGSAIYSAPIVENNVLYALTNNGYLIAYTLS